MPATAAGRHSCRSGRAAATVTSGLTRRTLRPRPGPSSFSTNEPLVPGDTGSADSYDLYRRTPGETRLIVRDAPDPSGPFTPFFNGSSADGDRVIFSHDARLVPADSDEKRDIYEWTASNGIRLLTDGRGPRGSGPYPVIWRAQSADARRVFFYTEERLVPEDIDGFRDIYVARAGALELAPSARAPATEASSRGLAGFPRTEAQPSSTRRSVLCAGIATAGQTSTCAGRRRRSRSAKEPGSRPVSSGDLVLFTTNDRLLRRDRDESEDLYRWTRRGLRLLSGGRPEGDRDPGSLYIEFAERSNARHAFFETTESLARSDRDEDPDLYGYVRGRIRLLTRPSR